MTQGIYSYGFASLAFFLLLIQLWITSSKSTWNQHLKYALIASFLWASFYLLMSLEPVPLLIASGIPDSLRIVAWASFINSLLKKRIDAESDKYISSFLAFLRHFTHRKIFYTGCALIAIQLSLLTTASIGVIPAPLLGTLLSVTWIIPTLLCLVLLERLYTATPREKRAKIRIFILGLGAMFIYDFYLFTNVMLFKQVPLDSWQARGILYGLLIPAVVYYAARNPHWLIPLHLSRQVVTGTATFLTAGTYLLATAFAASLLKLEKFEGASVLQITFFLLAVLLLLAILSSKKFRAECRVFVSKHFFNFKYDYRHEWLKFTEKLSEHLDEAPQAILHGMCDMVESHAGEIWGKNSNDQFVCLATRGKSPLDGYRLLQRDIVPIVNFLQSTKWLIDVDEYIAHSERYKGLELPGRIILHGRVWLIVPLPAVPEIIGFVLIDRSDIVRTINWEDRDLLKTAGHQAAVLLAQQLAHQALKEAGQFEAFNRLSAYIVHDLKNILGQQSLIVSNAKKHKTNPEFVDDVIATIDNSVQRMQRLLVQLREPELSTSVSRVDLSKVIQRVVEVKSHIYPAPCFSYECSGITVVADEDKLERVFNHIVQNAQEATLNSGKVDITLTHQRKSAVVKVSDTGVGMSEEFIANRLFKAFESTKGLTGMGIGLFESREYIQILGGSISVSTVQDEGSCFTVELPLADERTLIQKS